jgi:AcrR family transcriptional regulator
MKDYAQTRETYHHGNLPETLIHEAANLLSEKGAEGFSMREVARRAGVAVAAPTHHFGNAKGLLTAIATHGFRKLTTEQRKAMEMTQNPVEKVVALCRTYVDMGSSYPGYAAVMFRRDLLDDRDASYSEAASDALNLLRDAVSEATHQEADSITTRRAAKTLWAAMHGFVVLSLAEGNEANERIDFAVRTLLAGMSR